MPGYIVLYKFTPAGLSEIKGAPERVKQTKAAAEQMGVRVVGVWATLGEYDMVAVIDAPDDQTMAVGLLRQAARGYVTTQTMRAFSEDEFAQVVQRLA